MQSKSPGADLSGNTCPEGASKDRTQGIHGVTSLSTLSLTSHQDSPLAGPTLEAEGAGRAGATGGSRGRHVRKLFLLGCGKQPRLGALAA